MKKNENLPDLNASKDSSHFYPSSMKELDASYISNISNSKSFNNYYFLCKKCNDVFEIVGFKKDKIKLKCLCEINIREININEIFNLLLKIEQEKGNKLAKLKCENHNEEKCSYYCKECCKNICNKCCFDYCKKHENKIEVLVINKKTNEIIDYITNKIDEKFKKKNISKFYISSENKIILNIHNSDEDNNKNINKNINNNYLFNNNSNSFFNFNENDEENENIIKNNEKNNINNDEIISLLDKNFELKDNENYFISTFSIILEDYKNFPNYTLKKNILFIENFITYLYDNNEKIILKYTFSKDSIIDNTLELFGDQFSENNKEKCILIINDNILNLKKNFKISEIYDEDNQIDSKWSLEAQLIEKNNNDITDLSYMFYDISSLVFVDISNFNFKKVNKIDNMFSDLSSLCSLLSNQKIIINKKE